MARKKKTKSRKDLEKRTEELKEKFKPRLKIKRTDIPPTRPLIGGPEIVPTPPLPLPLEPRIKRPPSGPAPTPEPRVPLPEDFAFETTPTGETIFHGPGAERERGERQILLQEQEVAKEAEAAAGRIEEAKPDIDLILQQALDSVTVTGDIERDKLSFEQAIKSALAQATAGAVGGAVLGTVVTGGTAAIPLAIVGAIGGLINGFRSNLKTQKSDFIRGEVQNLMKTEQNMLKQVMLMNQLPRLGGSTDDIVEIKTMFDEQMALTDENNNLLEQETSDDLSKWLGEDGHKQLEKYKTFNSAGGMREILIKQMTLAINSPDLGRVAGLQEQIASLEEGIATNL